MLTKKISRFLGRNCPYFKGKDRIMRFLYSPDQFKNLHAGEKFVTNYYGLKYDGITSNFIDWGVFFHGGLERALVNYLIEANTKENFDYFFDIGANSGTLSLPIAKSKKTKVICFEPLTYNFNKLINNYIINDLYDENVFYKLALSNKKDVSKIYYSNNHSNIGTASLLDDYEDKNQDTEEIKLEKLDSLYNFKNKKIIIKIDVEGYEKFVIEGSLNLLKDNKILMYLETLNKDLLSELKKLKFEVFFYKFINDKYFKSKEQMGNNVILKNF